MERPLSFARVISRRPGVAQAGIRALAGPGSPCIEVRRESRRGKGPDGLGPLSKIVPARADAAGAVPAARPRPQHRAGLPELDRDLGELRADPGFCSVAATDNPDCRFGRRWWLLGAGGARARV